ncbi:MAG: glutathione S-transferase [Pseudomonadota bacterium]
MADYALYYWPVPFRGQPIRAVLAHVGASWEEFDYQAINAFKSKPPAKQPVPHMGPPVLIDHAADTVLSQMPAILSYLGVRHGLLPEDPARRAMTDKILGDTNDVFNDMTLHNGAQMWTPESWSAFRPRLERWMQIFEETGRRCGMTAENGFMLGTDGPGIADFTTAILWGTMVHTLPQLRPILDDAAPDLAGLCDRIAALPEQSELRDRSDASYGQLWCAGQIEASLRAVL